MYIHSAFLTDTACALFFFDWSLTLERTNPLQCVSGGNKNKCPKKPNIYYIYLRALLS